MKKVKVIIIEPDITEEENAARLENVYEVIKTIALELLENKKKS